MCGGARRRRRIFTAFFCHFENLSQLGKKYAYFLSIGGKICIFPPHFQSFPNMLSGHILPPPPWGRLNRKIYTPDTTRNILIVIVSVAPCDLMFSSTRIYLIIEHNQIIVFCSLKVTRLILSN